MEVLFAQWQGAGNRPLLASGARRLAELTPDVTWRVVPVEPDSPLLVEDRILGRSALLRQLDAATTLIATENPERLFTLGGDCAVELAPIAFLSARYPDLTVVWLDAHGDLNTPWSSPSGALHGMPLRHLLGEGDADVLARLPSFIPRSNVMLCGVRDLDPPERAYVDAYGLTWIHANTLNDSPSSLGNLLQARGARRLYLHLDLDVLEPVEFGALNVPTPGGVTLHALYALLADLHTRFDVVGGGLTEYLPTPAHFEGDAQRVVQAWLGREA